MRLDLDAFDAPTAPQPAGAPRLIALDDIDENPAQPRTEFDSESLAGLAATIAERGVRQPVSVRPHPSEPGRWMLNFGARRLRASRLAGRTDIPAFVDETADSYDQVIENEQREPMRPLDLALFVQRRLALGETQAEIARRLGKSKAYVTYATALIDAPDWLLAAYREGRCRGMRELHELRKLADEQPEVVEAWTSSRESVTRTDVASLRAQVTRSVFTRPSEAPARALTVVPVVPPASSPSSMTEASERPALCARLGGATVRIDVDRMPSQAGHVFVRHSTEASAVLVEASRLELLGFSAEDGRSTV